jgi:hypothetical protein
MAPRSGIGDQEVRRSTFRVKRPPTSESLYLPGNMITRTPRRQDILQEGGAASVRAECFLFLSGVHLGFCRIEVQGTVRRGHRVLSNLLYFPAERNDSRGRLQGGRAQNWRRHTKNRFQVRARPSYPRSTNHVAIRSSQECVHLVTNAFLSLLPVLLFLQVRGDYGGLVTQHFSRKDHP